MSKSSDNSSRPPQRQYFTEQERVRLMFLLKDLFPPSRQDIMGRKMTGFEWDFLYELLQRRLGRKAIGNGLNAPMAIEDFITYAPEDELITMMELMPVAHLSAFNHTHTYEEPNKKEVQRIVSAVNKFLTRIGSPARYAENGEFVRDGYIDETPQALRNLPRKEQLQTDLQTLRTEVPIAAVVFIDLDNFKAVNDQQGHAAGDNCLETVVSVIGIAVTRKGKLYRYGGDEFVTLLPNSTAIEAMATAERIRREIEKANAGGRVEVTASIGVAASDIDGIAQDRLLESADAAMYASKGSTKNCVTAWHPGMAAAPR